MGRIVFSTIKENIMSFFGKEDELLHEPKKVPEAASEVFEHAEKTDKRIVEKPLPESTKKLPFSPDELRSALEKKQAAEKPEAPQKDEPVTKEEPPDEDELGVFETALSGLHPATQEAPEKEAEDRPPKIAAAATRDGFFDEFERFLMDEDYDGISEMDVIHRMREFHKHQQDGKKYYVYKKDVQEAINRKLRELKTLEREWFHTRQEMDDLERGLAGIETEIEKRSSELKQLLGQAQSKSRLEETVPAGKEFVMTDGRKLDSLLDLRIALRTMPDDVFRHHVSKRGNDFAVWVRDVVGEEDLAKALAEARDQHEMSVAFSKLAG